MSKLYAVLVFIGLVYHIQGSPIAVNDELPKTDLSKLDVPIIKSLTEDDNKDMKPADKDSVVSGISVSSSSTWKTVDGVPEKETSVHIIRNDNGKITEDFESGNDLHKLDIPTIKPMTVDDIKNIKPAGTDSVVSGTSVSSSSTWDTVDGVPVKKETIGHAIQNDNGKITEVDF